MSIKSNTLLLILLIITISFSYILSKEKNRLKSRSKSLLTQGQKEMTLGDVTVKVLGHSGKMVITKAAKDANSTADVVTVTMSSIKEVDTEGNEVGKSGKVKHSFNNFAQLDFSFSDIREGKFQNVTVSSFNFTSTGIVGGKGSINVQTIIFREDGTINTGEDSKIDVKEGNSKFSILLQDWPFCLPADECSDDTCCDNGNEVGEYIDFELEMKGKNDNSQLNGDEVVLDGADIVLASDVMIDDVWVKMPEGYPKLVSGSSDVYTFRFPKFTSKGYYDPVIQFVDASESTGDNTNTNTNNNQNVVVDSNTNENVNTGSAFGLNVKVFVLFILGVFLF